MKLVELKRELKRLQKLKRRKLLIKGGKKLINELKHVIKKHG